MADSNSDARKIVWGLFAGLAAWGIYLAIGDFVAHRNIWRSLVTIGCMAAFLGLWVGALWLRKRRVAAQQDEADDEDAEESLVGRSPDREE